MNKFVKFIITIIQLLFIVSLLLISVDYNCFDKAFYKKEYEKMDTAASIGMSQKSLDETTSVLLDYLKDKRDDMVVTVEVYDVEREVFDERETLHMVDVKNLYLNAMSVKNISLIAWILMTFLLLWKLKKSHINVFIQTFKSAFITFGTFIAFLVFFVLIDFNTFWTEFHHVFFPMNDYWLLDPNTEILINMVPEQFFFDLVIRIVVGFVACLAVVIVLLFLLKKRGYKNVEN